MNIHLPHSIPSVRTLVATDHPRPLRDWWLLVSCAGVLLVASLAWNIWFFVKITKGEPIGAAPIVEQATEEDLLAKVRDVFRARAAEEDRFRREYQFIDPSK